jgi:hypothetical protein
MLPTFLVGSFTESPFIAIFIDLVLSIPLISEGGDVFESPSSIAPSSDIIQFFVVVVRMCFESINTNENPQISQR